MSGNKQFLFTSFFSIFYMLSTLNIHYFCNRRNNKLNFKIDLHRGFMAGVKVARLGCIIYELKHKCSFIFISIYPSAFFLAFFDSLTSDISHA